AYALRTRAPLNQEPKPLISFDLHVLGLPLAFILSQDQTLHCMKNLRQLYSCQCVCPTPAFPFLISISRIDAGDDSSSARVDYLKFMSQSISQRTYEKNYFLFREPLLPGTNTKNYFLFREPLLPG